MAEKPEDTPEYWMETTMGLATEWSRAAKEGAEEVTQEWERVASLVEQLAAAVSRGHESTVATRKASEQTSTALAGSWESWSKIKPRLAHLRRLLGGGTLAGMMIAPLAGGFDPRRESRLGETPEVIRRESRDLPPVERYRELARASKLRGDEWSARWFAQRAVECAVPQSHGLKKHGV